MANYRAEVGRLEQINADLLEALEKLWDACLRADAIGELHEFIDGSYLDAAHDAIAKAQPPSDSPKGKS